MLLQLADNYEKQVELRGKVKSAMTYPVVVSCFVLLAVIGMLLFVVPMFAKHVQARSAASFRCRRRSWSTSRIR